MNLKELGNKEFIDLLKSDLDNQMLWAHFVERFRDWPIGITIDKRFKKRRHYNFSDVEDVVQQVFLNLTKNDYRTMRNFRNEHDGSIIRLLQIMSLQAENRWINGEWKIRTTDLKEEILSEDDEDATPTHQEIRESVENCLDHILVEHKHRDRNKLIYLMHHFDGVPKKQISKKLNTDLSYQSICRIISGTQKLISKNCRPDGLAGGLIS